MVQKRNNRVVDLRGGIPRHEAPRREPSRTQESSKRTSPLRARRRRVRAIAALLILVVLAALAYGVHFVSYLPRLSINVVNVVGAREVPPSLVQTYVESLLDDGSSHFLSRSNMFLYPRAVIERAVAGYFPRIASASVSRSSLTGNAITVTVVERQPLAEWCALPSQSGQGAICYVMDSGGFIYTDASSTAMRPSTSYIFSGGIATTSDPIGSTFIPGHVPGVLALLKQLGNADLHPLGVSIDGDQDFSVQFQEGFLLKASFGEDADTLVKNLQLVLGSDALAGKESEIEYIDLRFGDRVYYKLNGQDQVTTQ